LSPHASYIRCCCCCCTWSGGSCVSWNMLSYNIIKYKSLQLPNKWTVVRSVNVDLFDHVFFWSRVHSFWGEYLKETASLKMDPRREGKVYTLSRSKSQNLQLLTIYLNISCAEFILGWQLHPNLFPTMSERYDWYCILEAKSQLLYRRLGWHCNLKGLFFIAVLWTKHDHHVTVCFFFTANI
jgi:hypothetical protein